MTAETLASTMDEITALKEFFYQAQNKLDQGEMMDMNGVDVRIATLCQIVKEADPTHQQIFLPELASLIDLLNAYEKALRKLNATFEPTALADDQR